MDTLKYKVTYKLSSKELTQEVLKNSKSAADNLCDNINNDLGGVAIVTEEMIATDDVGVGNPRNELNWNEEGN